MAERFTAASRPPAGQWAALARALEPCRAHPQPVPRPSAHPPAASPRPEGLESPGEKAAIRLLPRPPLEDHPPPADRRPSGPSNRRSKQPASAVSR